MEFSTRLQALQKKTELLERFLSLFAESLHKPFLYDSGQKHHGFRFGKPDERHFCLLKAIRAVSAFNAAIELAYKGFAQDLIVLLRVLIECLTHVEFVLTSLEDGATHRDEAKEYVRAYFEDFARNNSADFKRPQVRQGHVNKTIGGRLDEFARSKLGRKPKESESAQRFSNIYLTLSNYVHARYPETMDMYGGEPRKFHMRGMSGTPKDLENIEILETYFVTLSQSIIAIVVHLKLKRLLSSDPLLESWYWGHLRD